MVNNIKSEQLVYRLSPSTLNLLEDCPRCFWLHFVKKIKRPSGPMSSIPIKMDSIIKKYFNKYRGKKLLPPIIEGKTNGKLALNMPATLQCRLKNGFSLWGRPDDYLTLEDNNIIVLDHKTKSKPPSSVHPAYQLQMDVYYYLLKSLDYKTTDKAFLAFYYPDECDLHKGMTINCDVLEVTTDFNHVRNLVNKASDVLKGTMPEPGKNCQFCKWTREFIEKIGGGINNDWKQMVL